MSRKHVILMTAGCLLLVAAGCRKTKEEPEEIHAVPVRIAAVEKARLAEPVQTSGRLASTAEIRLSFKIGGIIDRFEVREGEAVRKGDVLASLNLTEIDAQVVQARSAYEKAKRDYGRVQNLFADSVVTLEQLQDARTGLEVAESGLNIALFNLNHARITAPENGRVLRLLPEAGELIGAGQPAILFGTTGGAWRVKAGVPDRDVVRLSPGDSAHVRVDAFPDHVFRAEVHGIAGAPDPANGTYEAELVMARTDVPLMNGFTAHAVIFPSRTRTYRVIPFESLLEADGDDAVVYTLTDDSTAVRVPVRIAFIYNNQAMVEQGLEKVHVVVTEGASYLRSGVPVHIRRPL